MTMVLYRRLYGGQCLTARHQLQIEVLGRYLSGDVRIQRYGVLP